MRDLHTMPRGSRGDVHGSSQTSPRRLRDVKSEFYKYIKRNGHPYSDAARNLDLRLSQLQHQALFHPPNPQLLSAEPQT